MHLYNDVVDFTSIVLTEDVCNPCNNNSVYKLLIKTKLLLFDGEQLKRFKSVGGSIIWQIIL